MTVLALIGPEVWVQEPPNFFILAWLCVVILYINVKKLQFIHTVNGDGSKTAKIIKRQC